MRDRANGRGAARDGDGAVAQRSGRGAVSRGRGAAPDHAIKIGETARTTRRRSVSTLSTHVLDISLGRPAQGIRVTLEQGAEILGTGVTDADGRVPELNAGAPTPAGVYRLRFLVEEY